MPPEPATRFAPSPTGPLHLGHAYAALVAHDLARRLHGRFLLRIEDLDRGRSRPDWEAAIHADLAWLGIPPDAPALRQSERADVYRAGLDTLREAGVLYACTCTRADILAAASAPHDAGHGPVYPGTCRRRGHPMHADAVLRLDIAKAFTKVSASFTDLAAGPRTPDAEALASGIGDVVIARRGLAAYHLACVVDDAAQGITHVTRGGDLLPVTPVQVLLQGLLGLPVPVYAHHRLIRDATGKRLAKRDDARSLARLRADGITPSGLRRRLGLADGHLGIALQAREETGFSPGVASGSDLPDP